MTVATPPAPSRLQSLDLIRGVAVMGILLLNITAFALPQAAYFNPRAYGGWHGADLATWLVNFLFFDGRMRGLFSFLFGASILLLADRAAAARRDPAAAHQWRMLGLLGFGLAHLWLVWDGDILCLYAIVGLIAFAFRDMPARALLGIGTLFALLGWWVEAQPLLALHDPALSPAKHARLVHDLGLSYGTPAAPDIAAEIARHRGSYAGLVRARFADFPLGPIPLLGYFGAETLAYMLFGMAALRSGLLRGEWPRPRYRRWLAVSWGIALPVYAALAASMLVAGFTMESVLRAQILAAPVRAPMITGWACLILLLARPDSALTRRIAATGRMAFTNYLCTSLICTTLFYGHGLGWFGTLSRWQLYPLVGAIWAAMLFWSPFWLARFRYGPFEWLWRSLTRARFESIRGPAR